MINLQLNNEIQNCLLPTDTEHSFDQINLRKSTLSSEYVVQKSDMVGENITLMDEGVVEDNMLTSINDSTKGKNNFNRGNSCITRFR